MAKLCFKNKWIVVTGASGGLGLEIAKELAINEKANLIIAARRLDKLSELKKNIEGQCDSKVIIIETDLLNHESLYSLYEQAISNVDVYGLINNAGITYYGKTDDKSISTFKNIVDVNFTATMILSLKFLSYFKEKNCGSILNITSGAALIPIPYQSVYSASKHAIQAFTEALIMENRNNNVNISIFAPGGIATEMLTNSGLSKKFPLDSHFNLDPQKAARYAIKAIKKSKYTFIPGFLENIYMFFRKLLPNKLVVGAAEKIYRPNEK
ncbi:SDR family NAD(P)-dependent oxidoreductase [Bacteroidota bacterium]